MAEIDRPVTRSDLRRLRQMGFGESVVAVMFAGEMKLALGFGWSVGPEQPMASRRASTPKAMAPARRTPVVR